MPSSKLPSVEEAVEGFRDLIRRTPENEVVALQVGLAEDRRAVAERVREAAALEVLGLLQPSDIALVADKAIRALDLDALLEGGRW